MFSIQITNEQSLLPIDERLLRSAVERILSEEGFEEAEISLAIVDDTAIRPLNRQYLGHDYATDVLSFALEQSERKIEGEVIVSAETAQSAAARFHWTPEDELLLYVVHGTLHLLGYDDTTDEAREEMRRREQHYLAHHGLSPHYE